VGLAVACLALLAGRAIFIATVRADDLSRQADRQQRATFQLPAPRGTILSRDGQVLALDRPTVRVSATPYLIEDPTEHARRLAPILSRTPRSLRAQLGRRSTYEILARNVDVKAAARIERLRLEGIDTEDTTQRVYPAGRLAAQLVGLVDGDGNGLSGMELQLDRPLTGRPGLRREAHDALGRPVRILADRAPVPGRSVRLTIDGAIQRGAELVLAETWKRHQARGATAVVMDPRDGKVLALATVPRFDPNQRRRVDQATTRQRPLTDGYEPGSVFKLVTVAGALEEGEVTPQTPFSLPPTITIYDRTVQEAHRGYYANWTVSQILQRSSNVGTVKIALQLGKERLHHWIERFGFGQRTGIDFPGEGAGFVRPAAEWYGTGIINIPIGYGDTVTLLQLARAYAAVANGGKLVQPYLVSRVGSRDRRPRPGRGLLRPGTAAARNEMLRGVVSPDGTGQLASVTGYTVAGKTGTARKLDPKTGQYAARYVASFVGYVPAEDPRLVVAVMVDEPEAGSIFGGDVAAPAFEQIAWAALQHLGIQPRG
jgi:cell division protein FtsI (penicillin-binding protein 3)